MSPPPFAAVSEAELTAVSSAGRLLPRGEVPPLLLLLLPPPALPPHVLLLSISLLPARSLAVTCNNGEAGGEGRGPSRFIGQHGLRLQASHHGLSLKGEERERTAVAASLDILSRQGGGRFALTSRPSPLMPRGQHYDDPDPSRALPLPVSVSDRDQSLAELVERFLFNSSRSPVLSLDAAGCPRAFRQNKKRPRVAAPTSATLAGRPVPQHSSTANSTLSAVHVLRPRIDTTAPAFMAKRT